jgi:hypothetical protein
LSPFGKEFFIGRGDVAHEVGGGLQVPVGRIDVDVTAVGRKRRHMRAGLASIRRTALQRADRKRVLQIVQTRAASCRLCDTCTADPPVESVFDRDVAQQQTRASTNTGSASKNVWPAPFARGFVESGG